MLHICCVRAGEAFSPAYVVNLKDMLVRNLEPGFTCDFVCFTDRPQDLPENIETRPLPADLPGWWSKLALFREGLFPKGDRVLFFDLDTLITGDVTPLAKYFGPFAILRDFYRPDGLQSAVMAWEAGTHTKIWNEYEAAGCPMTDPGGDQAWIERTVGAAMRLQDEFPGMFVSYKACKGLPDRASVVVFHGYPRPHMVTDGWVPKVWKEGGISHTELVAICNTAKETLLGNIRSACARDLRWFDVADEPHDRHVCIVGGGPSLKDTLWEIKARQEQFGQEVWALNNTAHVLLEYGIRVDVQVMVDARPENGAFVEPASEYLIASQCAPEVFNRLIGRNVTLWHANSPGVAEELAGEKARPVALIGGGTTVGMNALALAYLRGYRQIHLYGFDSSYRGGAHHAYAQALNDADVPVETIYRDKTYWCSTWMRGQAEDFMSLAPDLAEDDVTITVHGDGLLPDIARDLVEVMSPAEIRAHEVLSRVPNASLGVEIGVFTGRMSRALLKANENLDLIMVDSWEGGGGAYDGDSGDWHAGLTQTAQDEFYAQAVRRVKFAGKRARIVRKRSNEAAFGVANGSCDFVFIDADHSYDGCKADIQSWARKIKPGGWLCGHDYKNPDFPKFGVTRAVDEFAKKNSLEIEVGENYCWFIQMPVAKPSILSDRRIAHG